jgi:hypothetical protein
MKRSLVRGRMSPVSRPSAVADRLDIQVKGLEITNDFTTIAGDECLPDRR